MKRITLLIAALALLACGDDPTGTGDLEVATIEVTPAAPALEVGDTVRLTALARTEDGQVLDVPVTWAVSIEERAALAPAGRTARVTALRAGPVTVTAAAGGRSGQATLSVWNPAPAPDALEPASIPVGTGALTLVVRGGGFSPDSRIEWNGQERPTTYVSVTELAAAIGAADLATVGTAQVRVVAPAPGGGISASLSFAITGGGGEAPGGPVAEVRLDADSLVLEEGGAHVLVATPVDSLGQEVTGLAVQWSSSDGSVASVTPGGVVTPLRPGTTTITARVHGREGTATVRVFASYPYDLLYDQFTGQRTELLRLDIRDAEGAPARVFANARWAEDAVASPDGGRIAVVRVDSTGPRGIWLTDPDGSSIVELTDGVDDQPIWSPDGTRIAFRRTIPGVGADIWVIDVDGTGATNLTADQGATRQDAPAWAPSSRIAYSHAANGKAHIWTMAADGSGKQQLTAGDVYDTEPDWSPVDDRIVFQRAGAIWTVNASTGSTAVLVDLAFGQFAPAFSPDGALVAFASKDETGTFQVYTVAGTGGRLAQRTFDTTPVGEHQIPPHKAHPSWIVRP